MSTRNVLVAYRLLLSWKSLFAQRPEQLGWCGLLSLVVKVVQGRLSWLFPSEVPSGPCSLGRRSSRAPAQFHCAGSEGFVCTVWG